MKEAVLNTHHPESQGAPSDSQRGQDGIAYNSISKCSIYIQCYIMKALYLEEKETAQSYFSVSKGSSQVLRCFLSPPSSTLLS